MDVTHKYLKINADPGIRCSHLHPDSTCAYQVYYKLSGAIGKGFKFYIILHMITFLMFKVKKINNLKKFKD